MSQPAFMLPGLQTYATCIKFNPYLYKKSENVGAEPRVALLDLPYRMVFAVATTDQVIIYATDQQTPISIVGNVHYAPINDLAWCSNDTLVACSSDGYCSFITMNDGSPNLVGERLPNELIEDETLRNHYEQLDTVDLKKLENIVKSQKSQQFQPIAFRKKTASPGAPSAAVAPTQTMPTTAL